MENKQKHLEFIQVVINRLASNSFFLKGWAISLVAALFVLSAKDTNHTYILIAYFPIIIFWILDGYFLSQERLFRSLYDHVRILTEKEINYSMDTSSFISTTRNGWLNSMFSITLLYFYFSLIVVMWFVMYLIK